MARRYQNFLGGRLDVLLTAAGTSMSSPALAAMDEVMAGDEMIVVLDPDGLAGEPDIVKVTLHGDGSDTATITRDVEGATGREHPVGTTWVHGPIASDAPPAYAAYTPAMTQGVALTTSALVARYQVIGKRVHAWGAATFSNAGTAASPIYVPLPVAPHASQALWGPLGTGTVEDTGVIWMPTIAVVASMSGAGLLAFVKTNADAQAYIGSTGYSFAIASGDKITWNVSYEAA